MLSLHCQKTTLVPVVVPPLPNPTVRFNFTWSGSDESQYPYGFMDPVAVSATETVSGFWLFYAADPIDFPNNNASVYLNWSVPDTYNIFGHSTLFAMWFGEGGHLEFAFHPWPANDFLPSVVLP